jgi:hypothetical protein
MLSANTGLAANDVFYFGNAKGDFNVGNLGDTVRTNASDTAAVRLNQNPSVPIDNIYDINKDGRVNASDTALVRANQNGEVIKHFTAL